MTKPHQPWFIRRPTPDHVHKIHVLGMAGSGMGAFACMLKEAGYEVRGSDRQAYPPMSDTLSERGIPLSLGWDPAHLDWGPDWVIVGNVCRSDNPEAVAAEEQGIPCTSFPQAICDLFLSARRPIVITGTHGKTTTTTLCAWLLSETASSGQVGFLMGGKGANFEGPFQIGDEGAPFVIEGDEYDTAFFDKGPKFLHYRPEVALINNIEFDHADIYDSIEEIEENFERLCDLITPGKSLWVNADDQRALRCAQKAQGDVVTYGFSADAQWRATEVEPNSAGCRFTLHLPNGQRHAVESPLAGRHNVWNTIAALGIAHAHFERDLESLLVALKGFKGVQKRQEVLADIDDILVMDDYAQHPTAIRETVNALRAKYPERRLWSVYEPKSNTARRNTHQDDYVEAFAESHHVTFTRPFKKKNDFSADERLNLDVLVDELNQRGVVADSVAEIDELVAQLAERARAGDVFVFMSSSSFEGAQPMLIERLRARASRSAPQKNVEEGEDEGEGERSGVLSAPDPLPASAHLSRSKAEATSEGYPPHDGRRESDATHQALRRARRYLDLTQRLDRSIGRIAAARFVSACVLGASLISGHIDQSWSVYAWTALLGGGAFIISAWIHRTLFALMPRAQARADLARERAARLSHNWERLPEGGQRFARGYPEERELQIFGDVSLFKLLNRAHLRGAQARLARLLSVSSQAVDVNLEELTARQEASRELAEAHGLRIKLMSATRLSQPRGGARTQALGLHAFADWARQEHLAPQTLTRLKILSWVGLILTVATITQGLLTVLFELETLWQLTLIAQLLLYFGTTGVISSQYLPLISEAHKPLQGLASCYELIESRTFQSSWLQRWSDELNQRGAPSERIALIARRADALAVRHSALLYGVLSICLLWELWHGVRAAEWRVQFGEEIPKDLEALYAFEALVSIADFAAEHPDYAWPDIQPSAQGSFLSTTRIAHPLFPPAGRVPNDFVIDTPCHLYLVTGSNMSGKSSFMRALASNVTLALAGAPVCAAELSCPPLLLASSIQVTDDPSRGWSRFYAEVRRIRAVIERAESARGERPALFLIDEMLSGTNSRERRLASRSIATRLINAPHAAGVITTHDLDLAALTERFPEQLHLRHFSDHFDGERLIFDYTLKSGVARTTNALLVLSLEGIEVREENT